MSSYHHIFFFLLWIFHSFQKNVCFHIGTILFWKKIFLSVKLNQRKSQEINIKLRCIYFISCNLFYIYQMWCFKQSYFILLQDILHTNFILVWNIFAVSTFAWKNKKIVKQYFLSVAVYLPWWEKSFRIRRKN